MKKLFYFLIIFSTLFSCSKTQQMEKTTFEVEENFVAQAKNAIDYSLTASKDSWHSKVSREEFNVIYSHYSGSLSPSEFYAMESEREILNASSEQTILRRGTKKKIHSTSSITEFLFSNIGQSQDINSSTNFYSVGTSQNLITWQDAANSAFAESLPVVTDFNPELIDTLTLFSGCSYAFNYPYPLTVLNSNNTFTTYPVIGEAYLFATCDNETFDENGDPVFPLNDYFVEIPLLGYTNKLYFVN